MIFNGIRVKDDFVWRRLFGFGVVEFFVFLILYFYFFYRVCIKVCGNRRGGVVRFFRKG